MFLFTFKGISVSGAGFKALPGFSCNTYFVQAFYVGLIYISIRRENLFMPYANKKSADQSAHLHSLISAFVVRC